MSYINAIEGIEINVDNEYEVKAIQINDRVTNLETTLDTLIGGGEDGTA